MNNDLISREALKEHKFVGDKFVQIGGRTNGKTLESINIAYKLGWNDCIDAIVDNAPTVEERQRGKWIFDSEFTVFGNPYGTYKCDKCGGHSSNKYPFCFWCGADMRGEDHV